ncbi:MAG: 4'-phosphopantetheinyl transferase superfamily protein [Methylococcales bacterium]|nr:4'-phosphopantetheinyl transferase superfamily protein [Methylococcales bacterium]
MHFVDIRLSKLPADEKTIQQLAAFLDSEERLRAQDFKTLLLRDRYIAVRGMLRNTLGHYLAADPAGLRFNRNPHGKPELIGQPLHFNLSHSGDWLAIAVSDLARIGVDIERVRPRPGLEAIAERCFSRQEFAIWQSLPEPRRQQLFYQLWTKKEAFVKAVGRGLALGMEQCELDMPTGLEFASVPAECGAADDWQVRELSPDQALFPDLCGALVAPADTFCLRTEFLDLIY